MDVKGLAEAFHKNGLIRSSAGKDVKLQCQIRAWRKDGLIHLVRRGLLQISDEGKKELQKAESPVPEKPLVKKPVGDMSNLDHSIVVVYEHPGMKDKDILEAIIKRSAVIKSSNPLGALMTCIAPSNQDYFYSKKQGGGVRKLTPKGIARAKELGAVGGKPPEDIKTPEQGKNGGGSKPNTKEAATRRAEGAEKSHLHSFQGVAIDVPDDSDRDIARALNSEGLFGKPCLWKIENRYFPWNGKGRQGMVKLYYDGHDVLPPHMPMPDVPSVFHIDDRKFEWDPQNPGLPDEVINFVIKEKVLPPNDPIVI